MQRLWAPAEAVDNAVCKGSCYTWRKIVFGLFKRTSAAISGQGDQAVLMPHVPPSPACERALPQGAAHLRYRTVQTSLRFFLATALVALLCAPGAAKGDGLAEQSHADVEFALLRYTGGNYNPRPHGLPRLAWEIRKRTSIAMSLAVVEIDPSQDALYTQPLLVWQGDAAFAPLPQGAIDRLRAHLSTGGSLWVDVSDAAEQSPFEASVRRDLKRIFPDNPIVQVPHKHVVYKSFYLVDRHGGRVPRKASLDGIFIDSRLAVVISGNDMAGAMARGAFGDWEYDVGQGGEALREMTFRLGLNWVMYALCLDYKEDQVHLPFILQRRH